MSKEPLKKGEDRNNSKVRHIELSTIWQKTELCQEKVTQLQKLANLPSVLTKKRVVSGKGDTTPKVGKSALGFDKKASCVRKE
ncbi:MAG: hypothetical protein QM296_00880 [Bacillota bacterium]|nr:hypothetical protein [Bacillota bacterium]